MSLTATAVLFLLAQGAPADVAFDNMVANENAAAIGRIESNEALDRTDPARLINLGIAYAREGRDEEARKLLSRALDARTAEKLETASGTWVDSRALARRALEMLDRGEFSLQSRVTMR